MLQKITDFFMPAKARKRKAEEAKEARYIEYRKRLEADLRASGFTAWVSMPPPTDARVEVINTSTMKNYEVTAADMHPAQNVACLFWREAREMKVINHESATRLH